LYIRNVTSAQLKKWLARQGCTFAPGKGGHLKVRRGDKSTILPMHGSSKELGKGLVESIKRDLGLK
jgi:mRNA interferase HicA